MTKHINKKKLVDLLEENEEVVYLDDLFNCLEKNNINTSKIKSVDNKEESEQESEEPENNSLENESTEQTFKQGLGVMLDIETLGVLDTALVTQIGAVVFDLQTGETFEQFNQTLDLQKMDMDFKELHDYLDTLHDLPLYKPDDNGNILVTGIQEEINERFVSVINKFRIEQGTLKFWLQSKKNIPVLQKILSQPSGIIEKDLITNFQEWLVNVQQTHEQQVSILGNGIGFDIVKIKHLLAKYDLDNPIRFTL